MRVQLVLIQLQHLNIATPPPLRATLHCRF